MNSTVSFPSSEYVAEDKVLSLKILPTTATTLNEKINKPSFTLSKSSIPNSKKITTSKGLNKIMDRFTKTSTANVSETKIVTNAKIVIIAAYMRTGSTLMGGILHHHAGTFYLFEPIRYVFDEFTKARNTTELMYVSGKRR